MVFVTRREKFSSSHRLHNGTLSDEENAQIYDKCNNYYGHGHNYILEVTVAGEVNPKTGYVIDLKKLKSIIIENVINKIDHKHLNHDVKFMTGIIPTAENIAIQIWKQIEDKITEGKLFSIKIFETENNIVEYRGEQ